MSQLVVIGLILVAVALPRVHLSAEGLLDRAARFVGAQDIEFEITPPPPVGTGTPR